MTKYVLGMVAVNVIGGLISDRVPNPSFLHHFSVYATGVMIGALMLLAWQEFSKK
jgi:hypothetical protein